MTFVCHCLWAAQHYKYIIVFNKRNFLILFLFCFVFSCTHCFHLKAMLKKIFLQSTNFLPNNKTKTTKNNNNKNVFFFCAEKNIKLFLMLKKRVVESSAWIETLRYVVLKHAAQQRFKGGVVGGTVTCFAVASLACRRERQRERTRLKSLCMRYECEKRQTTLSVCGCVSAMCVAVNYVSIGGFRVTQFVFGTAQLERSKRKELLLFGARFNHPTTTVFLRQNNNNNER